MREQKRLHRWKFGAGLHENRKRAEYGFGEHCFKHRAQWVFLPSPSSRERTQWVPLSEVNKRGRPSKWPQSVFPQNSQILSVPFPSDSLEKIWLQRTPLLEGTFWDKFWRPLRCRALLFTPDSQPIMCVCVPKRTHRVFRRTHRVCRKNQWGSASSFLRNSQSKQYSARFLENLGRRVHELTFLRHFRHDHLDF